MRKHEGNTVSLSNVKSSSFKGRKVYERPGRHPFCPLGFSGLPVRCALPIRCTVGPGLFAIHRAVTSGADPDRDRVSGTETVFKNREELRAVTGAPAIPPDAPFYRRHGAHALPNPAGWPGASARLAPLELPAAWSARSAQPGGLAWSKRSADALGSTDGMERTLPNTAGWPGAGARRTTLWTA